MVPESFKNHCPACRTKWHFKWVDNRKVQISCPTCEKFNPGGWTPSSGSYRSDVEGAWESLWRSFHFIRGEKRALEQLALAQVPFKDNSPLVKAVPCPYCLAVAGEPCRSRPSGASRLPHAWRHDLFLQKEGIK